MAVLILGLVTSLLGSLPLGIISVLVMEIAAHRGWRAAMWAALGVSVVEYLQVLFAVSCIGLFIDYPILKSLFAALGLPLFLILAYQHLRHSGEVGKKQFAGNYSPFVQGSIASGLNMAAIPYWIVWGGVFISQGLLAQSGWNVQLFSAGSAVGTFGAMVLYIFVGVLFRNGLQRYNKYVNRSIGLIFLGFAALQIYTLVSQLWVKNG